MAKAVKRKNPDEAKTRWSIEKVVVPIAVAMIGAIAVIIGFIVRDSTPSCSAGKNMPCTCENGRTGFQTCADDGSKWLPCRCSKKASAPEDEPTAPVQEIDTLPESPPVRDPKSDNASDGGKPKSEKPPSPPTGPPPAEPDAVPKSSPKKVVGRAVCLKTNCTLEGNMPEEITNVCLDVRASETGEYRKVSRCVVNRRGVKTTCVRTGKDNRDPLVGDIRWRSPCP
jgi:hypothetical protein